MMWVKGRTNWNEPNHPKDWVRLTQRKGEFFGWGRGDHKAPHVPGPHSFPIYPLPRREASASARAARRSGGESERRRCDRETKRARVSQSVQYVQYTPKWCCNRGWAWSRSPNSGHCNNDKTSEEEWAGTRPEFFQVPSNTQYSAAVGDAPFGDHRTLRTLLYDSLTLRLLEWWSDEKVGSEA